MKRSWFSSPEGAALLWAGVLAGPTAWALDLGVSYSLVKWTCGHQHASVLRLITLGALLMIVAGAIASWRALAAVPTDATDEGGRPFDRGRFMAVLGLTTSALFAVVVIATAIPRWMIDACQ